MVVRAVAERPEYEIAGAFVYNPEKIGRHLGELCGIDPIGVKTTGDRQQMREAAADCVLFLAGAENDVPGSIADICMLLARSEEHTSELQSLMRSSYAVFCLKKKKTHNPNHQYATREHKTKRK